MSRLIDALERDGLVRRSPDRADARGVLVSITAAGRAALRARHRAPALARDLAALSEDERAVVARAADLIERLGTMR
jgi:DNA-binding MarR family transcriptional regulator